MADENSPALLALFVLAAIIGAGMIAANWDKLTATGAATHVVGNVTVNVGAVIAISLPNSLVAFGDMTPGDNNDTSDNKPTPFSIQNDGNRKVNITINATNLWTVAANPTGNYTFAANSSSEGTCFITGCSIMTHTNMPASGSPTLFMCYFNFSDSCDFSETEINVTVPSAEPDGAKNSVVSFIASQA